MPGISGTSFGEISSLKVPAEVLEQHRAAIKAYMLKLITASGLQDQVDVDEDETKSVGLHDQINLDEIRIDDCPFPGISHGLTSGSHTRGDFHERLWSEPLWRVWSDFPWRCAFDDSILGIT